MKNLRLKLTGCLALSLLSVSTFAQNWRQGGNGATPTSGNVAIPANQLLGTTTPFPLRIITNNTERMAIAGPGTGGAGGFIAMGNNLAGFTALDRLHLNHTTTSNVKIRFTNAGFANGSNLGIQANGDFRLTQFENQNVDVFTPDLGLSNVVQRFRIMPNGQVLVGNNTNAENVINGNEIPGFSRVQSSLLNVRGPINSCADFNAANPLPTILYGYTTPNGNPSLVSNASDGFRMHMNLASPQQNQDALVFEKTDWNDSDPDGKIAFTNTGDDGVEEVSAYITGQGRTYFGKTLLENNDVDNRVNIESDAGDASPSGLRLVNLPNTSPSIPNPTNKVLSVNSLGDVILVDDISGGGTGGTNGFNALINSVPEAPGMNCTNGGIFVTSGTDLNNNNVLDPSEITNSEYVCNGATGPAGPMGSAGSVNGAHNGTSISNLDPSLVALGQGYGEIGDPARLINNREVPLNGFKIKYTDGGIKRHELLYDGETFSQADVHAHHNTSEAAHYEEVNFSSPESPGALSKWNYGRMIYMGASTSPDVSDNALGQNPHLAAFGALNINSSISGITNGIFVQSRNYGTGDNVAGEFRALDGGNGNRNVGIFASATGLNSLAGDFEGDVRIAGNLNVVNFGDIGTHTIHADQVWAGGMQVFSDKRYKKEVTKLTKSTEKIKNINGYTYFMKTDEFKDRNFSQDEQIGLIAQEIKEVFPQLVKEMEDGYLTVNYQGLIPVLLEVAKEQQTQIEDQAKQMVNKDEKINQLNDRLTQLESCLSALLPTLCSMNQDAIQNTSREEQDKIQSEVRSRIEVRLNDKNTIILSQNVPNPFAETTTIRYTIPANVKTAQIHFYTANGVIINSVDVAERGTGELKVFAQDLSSGMYTYSLVADGKIVATKKMIKE